MDNNNSTGNISWVYNFPKIKVPDTHTTTDQLDKIGEELNEAIADIIFDRREEALLECIDVILAAETLHRTLVKRLGWEKVNDAVQKVIEKNSARNYFTCGV